MRGLHKRIFVAIAALCLAAGPTGAAVRLEPGLWQDTEAGSENGEPAKPEVSTECVTAADSKDPVKALTRFKNTAGQQCKTMNDNENGNTLSFNMECGDPKLMLISLSMTMNFLDARHYTGTVKSTVVFGGKQMSADKTIDAKWISAVCNKD
jgi:hypothetical protein